MIASAMRTTESDAASVGTVEPGIPGARDQDLRQLSAARGRERVQGTPAA